MLCKFCKQELPLSDFTKFDRNPVLVKERKGRVYVCRNCANDYVHERDNTKEALREILKIQDMPYIERYAEQARKNYVKKLKNTNIITQQNLYDGKVTQSKSAITIQSSIYACYCSRIGVIPRNYINYSYSDGIRDDELEKIAKKMELAIQSKELESKEVKSARRFINKMFHENILDDKDNFYKFLDLKVKEMDLQSSNATIRGRKYTLKKHIETLCSNNILDSSFLEPFQDKTNVESSIELNTEVNIAKEYNMDELRKKWVGFKDNEIIMFEDKYQELVKNYEIVTALHEEFLRLACISAVKGSLAMAKGDSQEAKRYMDVFKDLSSAGKCNCPYIQ